jgi:hypothetical protein
MNARKANKSAKLIFRMMDAMYAVMMEVGEDEVHCPLSYLSRRTDSFLINEGIDEALLSLKGKANSKEYLAWLDLPAPSGEPL